MEQIEKSTTDSKRTKGWEITKTLIIALKKASNMFLELKRLTHYIYFPCHKAMTFNWIFPYHKGLHLSLCENLRHRNEESWKTQELEWRGHVRRQTWIHGDF